MPIILKQAEISYNDNGTYKGINAIAQRPTAQMISQVQAVGAETIAEIEQKIVDSQSAINSIEAQKNTIIASIASIAEQGTDTTLTQSGVAADAKVTGDEIRDLKSALNDLTDGTADYYPNGLDLTKIVVGNITNDGSISEITTTRQTSDYIPVGGYTHYELTGLNSAGTQRVILMYGPTCFFDSNKNLISYQEQTASSGYISTIPQGTAFLRFSFQTSYVSNRQLMLEFVENSGDISDEYHAYGEIIGHKKGFNEISEDVETLSEDLEEITDATLNYINDFGNVENGTVMSGSGEFNSSYKYRVATPDIITAAKKYRIKISAGFRLLVVRYLNGVYQSGGFVSNGYLVPAGFEAKYAIMRVIEDTSEIADVDEFCSKISFSTEDNIESLSKLMLSENAIRTNGITWDWWITANAVDSFGNAYMGYVDTNGMAGVIRKQPDGAAQYKPLTFSYNNDDHNGMGVLVLSDGRILVAGSYGHSINNHIICFRSKETDSVDNMEDLSFDIPQNGSYTYKTCYSQLFEYDGKIFMFFRIISATGGSTDATGYGCAVSDDFGDTWTVYKAFYGADPYIAMMQSTDRRYIKCIYAHNPSSEGSARGCYADLDTYKVYDLSGTQIGTFVELNGGSASGESVAKHTDMTILETLSNNGIYGRLFYTGKTELNTTVYLYAIATDATNKDFTYKRYNNGVVTNIGNSGIPFGNDHYISGVCFGNTVDTVYYVRAMTNDAEGNYELHKVTIENNIVQSDEVITTTSICAIRPLYLGNGYISVLVGKYNDQKQDGTYNHNFTRWQLNPIFVNG